MIDMDTTANHDLIASDRVEGTSVYNRAGEKLGKIAHFMVEKRSGQVRYAVLSFGGFLGLGEEEYPLPWSMLKYDVGQEGYVVPLDRKQLEGAPAYERDDFDYDDAEWRDRVHTYYNAPPYWGL